MEARLSDKPLLPPSLEAASWQQIKEISDAGLASSAFKVGDMKKIVLNGSIQGSLEFTNYETYVYIIGIDHNKEIEGTGITFGCFKDKNGVDICLVDNYCSSVGGFYSMNSEDNNAGGWKNCQLRYGVLGSTDMADDDATTETATNPVPYTLMETLPSDLRTVMKPMTIYTDNTGGGSDNASYVTKTTDYLPLLAEYEIFGTRTYANSAEKNYQAQYAYYSTGNSNVKYCHSATDSTARWWERSPYCGSGTGFCGVSANGGASYVGAAVSLGLAPIFRV